MPLYRLKGGMKPALRHSHHGRQIAPGDTVELTPAQAKAFRDKFELVGPTAGEAVAKSVEEKVAEAASPRVEKTAVGGWNIVHPVSGKPINKEPFKTQKEAEDALKGA